MSNSKPEDAGSLLSKMMDASHNEDWEGVLAVAAAHKTIVGSDFELSWNVGWARFKLGQLEKAREHLQRATQLAPQKATGFWALGVVLRELGEYPEAETALLRALSIRDGFLPRLTLGILYLDTGRDADAVAIHREGVRLKPQHRERVEGLANMLWDLGRHEEAEELYQRAKDLPTREQRRKS